MKSINDYVREYRRQLEKGDIRKAYKGLMSYMTNLRLHFKNKFPEYDVAGSIYQGIMDMTFFTFSPEPLKSRKLKIAVVFVHEKIRFEVWLAGYNKQVRDKYWKLFKNSRWQYYYVPSTTESAVSIIEYILADNPDFSNLNTLTERIVTGTLKFTEDVMAFISGSSR